MEAKERIIVDLDISNISSIEKAIRLVKEIKDDVGYFKIPDGLSPICSYYNEEKRNSELKKLHALIGEKVLLSVKLLASLIFLPYFLKKIKNCCGDLKIIAIDFIGMGNRKKIKNLIPLIRNSNGINQNIKILAVIPSSLTFEQLSRIHIHDRSGPPGVSLAVFAQESGFSGVVTSIKEVKDIRNILPPNFLIAVRDIRPGEAQNNEGKTIIPPEEAIKLGADYLIVGSPVTDEPDNWGMPSYMAKSIAKKIKEAIEEKESV